jgi:hypothetical protein
MPSTASSTTQRWWMENRSRRSSIVVALDRRLAVLVGADAHDVRDLAHHDHPISWKACARMPTDRSSACSTLSSMFGGMIAMICFIAAPSLVAVQ